MRQLRWVVSLFTEHMGHAGHRHCYRSRDEDLREAYRRCGC